MRIRLNTGVSSGCGRSQKGKKDERITPSITKNKLTMTLQHLESLYPDLAEWTSNCEQLRQATTLPEMVWVGLQMGLLFARLAVEQEGRI
jgi:hypothetical protein